MSPVKLFTISQNHPFLNALTEKLRQLVVQLAPIAKVTRLSVCKLVLGCIKTRSAQTIDVTNLPLR